MLGMQFTLGGARSEVTGASWIVDALERAMESPQSTGSFDELRGFLLGVSCSGRAGRGRFTPGGLSRRVRSRLHCSSSSPAAPSDAGTAAWPPAATPHGGLPR